MRIEELTFKIGDKFIMGGGYRSTYMIAQTKSREYCLIDIYDGNRWNDSVYMGLEDAKNLSYNVMKTITHKEGDVLKSIIMSNDYYKKLLTKDKECDIIATDEWDFTLD